MAKVTTLKSEETGEQHKLKLYDFQPDGTGRLAWAAAKEAFGADLLELKDEGTPGLLQEGDRKGLTIDTYKPRETIPVNVGRRAQGTQAANVSGSGIRFQNFIVHSHRSHIKVRLPATCSHSEICSKVEEEWPMHQAADYNLFHQGKVVLQEEWNGFVQALPATKPVKLNVVRLGKSFSKYMKTAGHELREVLQRGLGVQGSTPDPVPEVDQEFPAYSLPSDETRISGDITLGVLLNNLAQDLVHKLAAMGDIQHGTEYTNREYITPVLVTAVIIVRGIRPAVTAIQERLLLRPEQAVLGRLAWGPVDYVIFYRLFMIIVTEAKRIHIEHALAQHIMQVAAARDTLARQVEQWKREHNARRKRRFWEMSELNDVPTDGILSTGNYWILTRFIPSKDSKPAQFIKSKCLALGLIPATDCTVTKLVPELRVLVARIVQMMLSQVDIVDSARSHVAALRELTTDPTALANAVALDEG